ncbi:hypothetical protein OU995_13025 [Roseateles sp. SL47]|uniref:hypothetical protein n=1 Tax=Roseateles sp. SL47 TaxID=2995138 RepID=UPI00226D52F5|nr:hypothetical protein [Roseateles sp. SL47]WAC75563.1 hypothetical protein OU995_13025 [Roseateles sp. SL47]
MATAAAVLAACGGGGTIGPPTTVDVITPADRPCAVAVATPASGATDVLVNVEPTVISTGPSAGACADLRLADAEGNTVPTTVLISNDAPHPDGGAVSTLSLQPQADLSAASTYSVYRGNERLFNFTTGNGRAGLPVLVTDLPAAMKGLPALTTFQPAQINDLISALALELANGSELVAKAIEATLSSELPNFSHPNAQFAARIQKITYTSSLPDGRSVTLSGLMVLPVHPDGSPLDYSRTPMLIGQRGAQDSETPGPSSGNHAELLPGLMAAGRGHIFIAPDLIGVGDTASLEQAYLVARDTGVQTRDMLRAVRAHLRQQYGATDSQDLRIVGSSQGGYSVFAALPYLAPMGPVKLVSTLAGPFDLDRTYTSNLLALAGQPRDAYSKHENLNLVPSRLKSSLDALKSYQQLDYDPQKVFDASGGIQASFLEDFKAGRYNHLRVLWRSGSAVGNSQRYVIPEAKVVLYHFSSDPLVPSQNTSDLLAKLKGSDQSVGSVEQGSCHESSLLTKLILQFSKSQLVRHTLCAAYQYNDLVEEL